MICEMNQFVHNLIPILFLLVLAAGVVCVCLIRLLGIRKKLQNQLDNVGGCFVSTDCLRAPTDAELAADQKYRRHLREKIDECDDNIASCKTSLIYAFVVALILSGSMAYSSGLL